MADTTPNPDSNGEATDNRNIGQDRGSLPKTPRWVKVLGIVTAVAVLLVVIGLIAGGNEHGPSRHLPGGGNSGGHTTPVEHSP